MTDEHLDISDPEEGSSPDARTLAWLQGLGVSIDAIAYPWSVLCARVTVDDAGRYRPCPGVGVFALIFAVIDVCIIDLAAWEPTTGRLATRLGAGAMLGEGQIGRDGIGTTGCALPIWPTPLEWLRANRCGVVIADPMLAAHRLSGYVVSAQGSPFRRNLRQALRVPPPVIVAAPAAQGVRR